MPRKKKEETTEKTVTEVRQENAAKAAEKKSTKAGNTVFKYVAEPSCKLAPQAQVIVAILKEAGENGLTRNQLTEAMVGVVETRQPHGRILSYYQKKLLDSGAIVTEEPAEETPAEEAAE